MAADLGFAGGGKTARVHVGLEGSVKAAGVAQRSAVGRITSRGGRDRLGSPLAGGRTEEARPRGGEVGCGPDHLEAARRI